MDLCPEAQLGHRPPGFSRLAANSRTNPIEHQMHIPAESNVQPVNPSKKFQVFNTSMNDNFPSRRPFRPSGLLVTGKKSFWKNKYRSKADSIFLDTVAYLDDVGLGRDGEFDVEEVIGQALMDSLLGICSMALRDWDCDQEVSGLQVIHSFIHSFIHSVIQSFTYLSVSQSVIHLLYQSVRQSVYSLLLLSIYSLGLVSSQYANQ